MSVFGTKLDNVRGRQRQTVLRSSPGFRLPIEIRNKDRGCNLESGNKSEAKIEKLEAKLERSIGMGYAFMSRSSDRKGDKSYL